MKAQPTYKTEAIILRSTEIREYDRIYTIFSREKGKMQVLGIGTRKPKAKLASGLEPLTKSELFCVQGRRWDRVAGVIIDDQFPQLKKDLEAMIEVKKTFRIVEDLLTQEEPSKEVYAALGSYLARREGELKDGRKNNGSVASLTVFWKAIGNAGYRPQLYNCLLCSKKVPRQKKYKFQVPDGIICDSCEAKNVTNKIQLDENSIKALRFIVEKKPQVSLKLAVPSEVKKQLKYLTKLVIQQILEKAARL
jgi:DNA repair protein RecO (recombination protein O)